MDSETKLKKTHLLFNNVSVAISVLNFLPENKKFVFLICL